MYSKEYTAQFELLLDVLPCLIGQDYFALKGGTAINLFYQDFPRISVDIDLTYRVIEDRGSTIKHIEEGLDLLISRIKSMLPASKINRQRAKSAGYTVRLEVHHRATRIKIEPNFVLRGTVNPCETLTSSPLIESEFTRVIKNIPVISFDDVYAGKFCAALSRQHPRDLFDVMVLLKNGGITDSLRKTFLVYLVFSPRPMHELLDPNKLDYNATKISNRKV